ncbi:MULTISPECIES: hypothetical protein [unclassified Roseateles]|nr:MULTISPECIES: hypothetical protein [unclassified Roseateles]
MKRFTVGFWRHGLPALLLLAAGALIFRAWLAPEHLAAWLQILPLCS